MADPYIGEIRMITCSFAPVDWAKCEGQLVDIGQYSAVFSILGTSFGGDGRTSFGLPDFRGRLPVGAGSGPGLTHWYLGYKAGAEQVALQPMHMDHGHTMRGNSTGDGALDPENHIVGISPGGHKIYAADASPTATLNASTVSTAPGGGSPHDNMMPYQCLNYIICMKGLYPPRS